MTILAPKTVPFGSHFGALFVFGCNGPTCVWNEPAAADCVWGLPGSLQECLKNVLELWLGFEARFLAKNMPKVSKMGSQMGRLAPGGGGRKVTILEFF